MQRVILALTLLFLTHCAVGPGCSSPPPNLRGPQVLNKAYEEQVLRWTVSGTVHHSLDRIIYVYSTYLTPSFRQAFNTQYRDVFGIDPGRVDSDLEMIATSPGRGYEFFLFADTDTYGWNNLDEKDSVWRVGLWGCPSQVGVAPSSIQGFRGRGPNLAAFFPFLNDFGRSYLVVFPREQQNGQPILDPVARTLTVKMASAFGTVTMTWKVEE